MPPGPSQAPESGERAALQIPQPGASGRAGLLWGSALLFSSRCRTLAPWQPPRPRLVAPEPTRCWGAWRARSSGGSCRCGSRGRRSSTGKRCSARLARATALASGWTELGPRPLLGPPSEVFPVKACGASSVSSVATSPLMGSQWGGRRSVLPFQLHISGMFLPPEGGAGPSPLRVGGQPPAVSTPGHWPPPSPLVPHRAASAICPCRLLAGPSPHFGTRGGPASCVCEAEPDSGGTMGHERLCTPRCLCSGPRSSPSSAVPVHRDGGSVSFVVCNLGSHQ